MIRTFIHDKLIRDTRGMTLIDMAIALLVISLIAVPMIQIYNVQRERSFFEDTNGHFDAVRKSIDDFYFTFGRYPCPADLTVGPGSPTYGQEAQPCNAAGSANVIIGGQPILRGGVPFAALQIPMSFTLDGWSNKMTYTVTTTQTVPTAPAPFPPGALSITRIECSAGVCAPATTSSSAHYILVSHGDDGIGGYTQNGVLQQPCPPAGPTFTREAENCDDDTIFWESESQTASQTPDANYYDDWTFMKDNAPTRIWMTSSVSPNDIFAAPNISIGVNNDNPQRQLDVVGNILADQNTAGDSLCDINGNNCFTTWAFTQANSQMSCAGVSGTAMTGLRGDVSAIQVRATCGSTLLSATPNQTCPAGKRVIGIDAGGTIQCEP